MSHVAIVTGANHGIGAAVATALARRGDAVLCAWYRVADRLGRILSPVTAEGWRQQFGVDALGAALLRQHHHAPLTDSIPPDAPPGGGCGRDLGFLSSWVTIVIGEGACPQ